VFICSGIEFTHPTGEPCSGRLLSGLGDALTRPLGRVLQALRASALIDAVDKLVVRYRGRLGRFFPEDPPRRYVMPASR